MVRHNDLGTVGNENFRLWHSLGDDFPNLLKKHRNIQCHTVTDNAGCMIIEYTGWQRVKRELSVVVDDGMPGIRSSLETHDNVRSLT